MEMFTIYDTSMINRGRLHPVQPQPLKCYLNKCFNIYGQIKQSHTYIYRELAEKFIIFFSLQKQLYLAVTSW